ncbi:hypothetical protein ACFL5Z_20955, partial [Planctomycetota bacterium]
MKRKVTTERYEILKRVRFFSLALMVVSFISSSVYALDPIGPPACDLQKGEFKGGIDVSLSRQDLNTSQGNWTQTTDGVLTDSGIADLGTLKDFETYRAYATVAYSPIHNWEAFLRLGGVVGKLGDEFWSDSEEFDSRPELAVGAGIRATFFEEIALKIGGLVQANWSEFDGKVDASHWAAPDYLEIRMLEVQAAVGATYMFSDRLSIYGGPFAHLIYGDLDYVYSEANIGDFITWRFDWDIEDDINYGGFFGARIVLRRDCAVNIEYQQTSDAQAIG